MKKIIFCLLFSALIGVVLGIYSFKMFNKDNDVNVYSSKDAYAIQIGVFEDINNAEKLAGKYGSIIVKDNNKYRVYIAIVKNMLKETEVFFDKIVIPLSLSMSPESITRS